MASACPGSFFAPKTKALLICCTAWDGFSFQEHDSLPRTGMPLCHRFSPCSQSLSGHCCLFCYREMPKAGVCQGRWDRVYLGLCYKYDHHLVPILC